MIQSSDKSAAPTAMRQSSSKYVMTFLHKATSCLSLLLLFSLPFLAQPDRSVPYKSQELSEIDGIPVLIKHLPEWETVKSFTVFATEAAPLKAALGERPVLDLVDFSAGTEAVTAPYDTGRLLIIEYMSPQLSVDADEQFTAALGATRDATTVYRRIGNYNAFVFDVRDRGAGEALLDQVKYEKQIQWLGDNPFIITAERAFVLTTSDIFLSTAKAIVYGMGGAVIVGIFAGYIFFVFRDGKRSKRRSYSDAGGMTRLNLDGFTADVLREGILKD